MEKRGEGVTILMKEYIWIYVQGIRRISSTIMCVGICIKRELWSAPGMKKSEEERDRFWEELRGCIEAYEDKGEVLVIRDMNVGVGDSELEAV